MTIEEELLLVMVSVTMNFDWKREGNVTSRNQRGYSSRSWDTELSVFARAYDVFVKFGP